MSEANRPPAVAVVVSRYNSTVTSALLEGALEAYARRWPGGQPSVLRSPGAFELVALCAAAARSGAFEAVVALGCVIRGQTRHDTYISQAVAQGLAGLSAELAMPVCFGVLTVENAQQAMARAGLPVEAASLGLDETPGGQRDRSPALQDNKGAQAMDAALEAVDEIRRLRACMGALERLSPEAMPPLHGGPDKSGPLACAPSADGQGSPR